MQSSSRRAMVLILAAAVGLGLSTPLGAVQSPSTAKYDGPNCFSTVIDAVSGRLGTVLESRDNPLMAFGTHERIYVQAEEAELETDREYLLYREEAELEHPLTGELVGTVVNLLGRARVLDTEGQRTLAVISHACAEIEPGDRLHELLVLEIPRAGAMPQYDPDQLITPQPEDATVIFGSGETVRFPRRNNERGSLNVRAMYGAGDVVTIDRGLADGWDLQLPVLFYRAAGALGRGLPPAAEQTPVAQGVVFWAGQSTAAVLITSGDRALEVGAGAVKLR